jgi:sugar transferase (PEP-CTERM/EpsH1 system associated)
MQAKALESASTITKVKDNTQPPLIAHILYRFAVGGLENGVVNLINQIPETQYRHVVISLTDATDFKNRIKRDDVDVYCLGKKPGHDFGLYLRLWKLLRRLKPDITHTRNLAALEMVVIAMLAGVKKRVHSEHGWGINDLHGANRKHQKLRSYMSKLTHSYIGLSKHIINYLHNGVGIPSNKLTQIYNGVDADRFMTNTGNSGDTHLPNGFEEDTIIIGTVGRMEAVKSQTTLAEAFVLLGNDCDELKSKLRLVMIGDGDLRIESQNIIDKAGLSNQCWMPGARDDVAAIMNKMDIFVLPSRNEGISNTILEAMATGLPVVATRVGGNPELVSEQETGLLVEPDNPYEMMLALKKYVQNAALREDHGHAARERVTKHFRIEHMVDNYLSVYNNLI